MLSRSGGLIYIYKYIQLLSNKELNKKPCYATERKRSDVFSAKNEYRMLVLLLVLPILYTERTF